MRRFLASLACGWVAILCGGSAQSSSDLEHKAAPQFVRTDLRGRQIDLESYRGEVVLLNFWATWCGPCQVELPRFDAWQKKYEAKGLQVLTISMDDGDAPVRRTVRRLNLSVPVVMGDAKLGEDYGGVLGLPVTFLIGRDGVVAAKVKGETDLDKLESRVTGLLAR